MSVEQQLRRDCGGYLARDFVETAEGLLLAVVAHGLEEGRVLCWLRYLRRASRVHKLTAADARELLRTDYPSLLYRSAQRDVVVHAVPRADVTGHYRPVERLAEILRRPTAGGLEQQLLQLVRIIAAEPGDVAEWGVTGSLLIGAQHPQSDIDLVCYARPVFHAARRRLRAATRAGLLEELSDRLWREAYARRGCALSYEEYCWHERRKDNKFSIAGTKVDVSLIAHLPPAAASPGHKRARVTLRATVTDDTYAFDSPACYSVDHARVSEIVCPTPTYVGQARRGEMVEAAGWVEETARGSHRLVIGTSREAPGEYLRVLRGGPPP